MWKVDGNKGRLRTEFKNYFDGVIKKASNKVNYLSRVTPFSPVKTSPKIFFTFSLVEICFLT